MSKLSLKEALKQIRKIAEGGDDDFKPPPSGTKTTYKPPPSPEEAAAASAAEVKSALEKAKSEPSTSEVSSTEDPSFVLPGASTTVEPSAKPTARYTSTSDQNIINMQNAIKEFANKLSPKATTTTPGVEAPKDPQEHFNDFLVEQYSEQAPIHGKERDTSSPTTAKTTRLYQMSVILQNLQTIGSSKDKVNQFKVDGNWGPKTNQAVLNIVAFAHTFMKVIKDFEVKTSVSFTDADLKNMSDNSIKDDRTLKLMSNSIKSEKAKALAPLIDQLSKYYEEYVRTISENPQFTRSIKGEVPLFKTKKPGADSIKPELQPYMSKLDTLNLLDVQLPGPFGNVKIPRLKLSSLKDRDAFTLLLSSLNYNTAQCNNPAIQKKVLDAILLNVSDMNGAK